MTLRPMVAQERYDRAREQAILTHGKDLLGPRVLSRLRVPPNTDPQRLVDMHAVLRHAEAVKAAGGVAGYMASRR